MSLVCMMEKCKAKSGPCLCEKILGLIVVAAGIYLAVRCFQ